MGFSNFAEVAHCIRHLNRFSSLDSTAKLNFGIQACSPWAGCDAYLLLPTSLEIPGNVIHIAPRLVEETTTGGGKGAPAIQIKKQP